MTLAILTCDEVRAAEQRAVEAGISLWALMQKAGQACADVLHAEFPEGRVVVLAGPGNNGGDAFVAAQRLRDLGRNVWLYDLAPTQQRTPEGINALNALTGARQPLEDMRLTPDDIVLDGLFGAGLSRPLSGEAAFAAEQVNASGSKVVAIDVPSGVNGDTGAIPGPAIRANVTVTFCAKKPAHVLQPAASLCGEVIPAEIGFGRFINDAAHALHENAPALWANALRWPEATSHKHQRGRLAVVSGGLANTGAARLAAHSGLRIGAGLVTLLCAPSALIVAASSVTAVMTSSFAGPDDLVAQTERSSAIIIGPAAGFTDATRANVEALCRAGRRLVLDADALTVFADQADHLRAILPAASILTPHTGEFERLFPGLLGGSVNKVEAVRTAAHRIGATVLLKGADTIIAAPEGRAVVNTHATPFLATAGSGDVLAGIVGGLLAQGLTPFDAARAAAWLHGDAGFRVGPGLTAEDLDASLRETVRNLYETTHPTGE
ncbi:MAG: NAD(P)H-hydrate dehydratase [Hyphomonadaceae bacterium]|nr:NAD(P)H-hydrate dehydratase [Hyphomonadaceae bacterium]